MRDLLLVRVLKNPKQASMLSLSEWDGLLRQARKANLMSRLQHCLEIAGIDESVPACVRVHLESAKVLANNQRRAVVRELEWITKALSRTKVRWVLMKGAAYVMSELPVAEGRLFSDIDILVSREDLPQVEAALLMHGWITTHHDAYDQRYYREWMHELPPMRHIKRGTVIDVHHAILPPTARLHPESARLMAAARGVSYHELNYEVLQLLDLVLHSATHLMHESEFDNGLRDLVDIDALFRYGATQDGFWQELVPRAQEMDLVVPLYYASRYCSELLETPIPEELKLRLQPLAPGGLRLKIMDSALSAVLTDFETGPSTAQAALARRFLYVRGNWLRMPPLLLAKHLFHKAFISPKEKH